MFACIYISNFMKRLLLFFLKQTVIYLCVYLRVVYMCRLNDSTRLPRYSCVINVRPIDKFYTNNNWLSILLRNCNCAPWLKAASNCCHRMWYTTPEMSVCHRTGNVTAENNCVTSHTCQLLSEKQTIPSLQYLLTLGIMYIYLKERVTEKLTPHVKLSFAYNSHNWGNVYANDWSWVEVSVKRLSYCYFPAWSALYLTFVWQ